MGGVPEFVGDIGEGEYDEGWVGDLEYGGEPEFEGVETD